ncbi:AAA family ATPase [Streptomyces sp. OF3]|uniref:AAA family ATPase n=1 Tax=Streptomyces alkaliterrae TaxID=2213162 RepID=A0A7W3WHB9_9ACTN|nr:AAA family ATPase [Streptomyces alkaliterrae]
MAPTYDGLASSHLAKQWRGPVVETTERCGARRLLEELAARAQTGDGCAALVLGAPGMGRTSLVHHVQAFARRSGATVLSAVASAAERALPLGVVTQLLASHGLTPDEAAKLREVPAAAVDTVHRLVSTAAERSPLVITVDDVHEADDASLACLLYLARRVSSLRVLVVLSGRAGLAQGNHTLMAECVRNPRCRLLRLAPMSLGCTESLLAEQFGAELARQAAPGWQHACGGSPLLLEALLRDRTTTREPAAAPAAAEIAPPPGGEAVRLAVQYVLGELGDDVVRTAQALAVLGAAGPADNVRPLLRHLGVPLGRAEQSVAALEAAGLVEGARYRLDTARAAVLDEMAPDDRALLHLTAARVLRESGAEPGDVARHLMCAGPCAEEWAISALRDAAAQALREHDAEWAATCLRSAYDACGDRRRKAAVHAELAAAEWESDPTAVRHRLAGLLADHSDGQLSHEQGLMLITYLLWLGRPQDADALLADLDAARDRLPEHLRARLDALHIWFAYFYPLLGTRYRSAHTDGETALGQGAGAVDRHVDGAVMLASLLAEGPAPSSVETAEQLLQGVVLHDPPVAPAMAALISLIRAARLDRAAEWCDVLVRDSTRRTATTRAILLAASAILESWLGRFETARRRADQALALLPAPAWGVAIGFPLSAKALACAGLGDVEESAACFRVPVPQEMFQSLPGLHYLQARGRHHLSAGRYHAALGDFYACRDLLSAWRLNTSVFTAWRVYAAETLIELGSPAQAGRLLREELAQPVPGSAWLRAEARRLHDRLAPTPPRASRHAAADRCADAGAGTGATPGAESPAPLSRAEQRVARLAADGLVNREIAERLFITPSTVEQHLTRVYQKLGVRGRAALPQALGRDAAVR